MRAGEVLALQVSDVKLQDGLVTVVRGKGGKGRICPFGSQTAASIDRYLRARRSHRLADTGTLWVGASGKSYGYFALNAGLKARAKAAGIHGFHPQLLRHTAATRWLRAGGSEGGLDVGRRVVNPFHARPLHQLPAQPSAPRPKRAKLGLGEL